MLIIDSAEFYKTNPEIKALEDYVSQTEFSEFPSTTSFFMEFDVIDLHDYYIGEEEDEDIRQGWYRLFTRVRDADRYRVLIKYHPHSHLSSNQIN